MINKILSTFLIIFTLCCVNSYVIAEEIIVKPRGEFATIDVDKSWDVLMILKGETKGNKKKTVENMIKNPGDYNPAALLWLGLYLLENKDYSQGALYIRLALFRCIVDVEAAKDPSLSDVQPIFWQSIAQFLANGRFNKEEITQIQLALKEQSKNVVSWDKATPRNYDVRWPCLHSIRGFTEEETGYSDPAEYQRILNQNYDKFDAMLKSGRY